MDVYAPEPSGKSNDVISPSSKADPHHSAATVTVVGCGGCGINLSRPHLNNKSIEGVKYFDTSMTNSRSGESVFIVTNGSGSGSDRSKNARDIESIIPQIPEQDMGTSDVAIIQFSLSGGKQIA